MIQINHGTATVTVVPGTAGLNDAGNTSANYQSADLAMALVLTLRALNQTVGTFTEMVHAIDQNQGPRT